VEQTIARGGIAVLHLEENPREPELQVSEGRKLLSFFFFISFLIFVFPVEVVAPSSFFFCLSTCLDLLSLLICGLAAFAVVTSYYLSCSHPKEVLFAMTQQLLSAVVARYPEYHSNLLYFITSNYPPAEAISRAAKVCMDCGCVFAFFVFPSFFF
jgi:hypothetical protein